MGTFSSELFTKSDPAVLAMLEDCANGLPTQFQSHFSRTENARGDHITTVQTALAQIQKDKPGLGIPAFAITGIYDPAFAAAVKVYKANCKPPLLNHSNQIDDVVGVKTIRQIDKDLPAAKDSPNVDPAPDVKPPRPQVDVYMYFSSVVVPGGQDITSEPGGTQGFRALPLMRDMPIRSISQKMFRAWAGSLMVNTGILAAADFLEAVYDTRTVARVVAYGYSAGGSNLLDLGRELENRNLNRDGTTKKFLIIDVAITVDAAQRDDMPRRVERVVVGSIRKNINYFQTSPSFRGAFGGLNSSKTSNTTKIRPDTVQQLNMDSILSPFTIPFHHGEIEEKSLPNVRTDLSILSFAP